MPVYTFPFATPTPGTPPVVSPPGINSPSGNTGFRDARFVREPARSMEITWGSGNGAYETVNDGKATPWNRSNDGFRLVLTREADLGGGEFAYTLPIGDQDWLAPTTFRPKEIEFVSFAELRGPEGIAVSLDRAATVLCKPATFGHIHRPPTRATRIPPGGILLMEYRARVICPRAGWLTCTDAALVVGWYPTPGGPAVTMASKGASVVAFRNAGFGWETA